MPLTYQETLKTYKMAQIRFNSSIKTHEAAQSEMSLRRLQEAKLVYEPIRDSSILFAINHENRTEGAELFQFIEKKGGKPASPLSDGRLPLDLATMAGNSEVISVIEAIKKQAEEIAKITASFSQVSSSLATSVSNLGVFAALEGELGKTNLLHTAAEIDVEQKHLDGLSKL